MALSLASWLADYSASHLVGSMEHTMVSHLVGLSVPHLVVLMVDSTAVGWDDRMAAGWAALMDPLLAVSKVEL